MVEVDLEEFTLVPREAVLASDLQKYMLCKRNVPVADGLTFQQASYLLWKCRFMEKHGIDYENYWKEWRVVEGDVPEEG